MEKYANVIAGVKSGSGALLDAIRAAQDLDGYLTEEAMEELARGFDVPVAQVYETASFYSMIRFRPGARNLVEVCKNAPCHVAGAGAVVEALEKGLGVRMGESTPDGKVALRFTECIGQCQSAPSVVVNGKLFQSVNPAQVTDILQTLA